MSERYKLIPLLLGTFVNNPCTAATLLEITLFAFAYLKKREMNNAISLTSKDVDIAGAVAKQQGLLWLSWL